MSERHPQVAVVALLDARVDRVDAGVGLRRVPRQVGAFAEHLPDVGLGSVDLFEAGVGHRADVSPVALDVVGGEQHDCRSVVSAVDRHVHAPLFHRCIPDDVRGPHVALDVRVGGLLRPVGPDVGEDLLVVGAQVVFEAGPVDEVVAFQPGEMRPEDVVLAVGLDDGWIVRFAALDLGGAGLAGVAGVLGVRRCVRVGVRRAAASVPMSMAAASVVANALRRVPVRVMCSSCV